MSRIPSLQDPFLNALRKEKVPLFIFLLNGIKLKGIVEAFDQFSIILKNDDDKVVQMIYKHSIATMVPTRLVRFVYSNYVSNHNISMASNNSTESNNSKQNSNQNNNSAIVDKK